MPVNIYVFSTGRFEVSLGYVPTSEKDISGMGAYQRLRGRCGTAAELALLLVESHPTCAQSFDAGFQHITLT